MRTRVLLTLLSIALAISASAAAAAPFKAVFTAPTHTPKINAKWPWQLKVTDLAGKPIAATITVQIVDPLGGVHAVEFGCCKKFITNHPIKGSFRDYAKFPPEAQGYPLTFQVIVKAAGGTQKVKYLVTPR